jgi:hypothetical protein
LNKKPEEAISGPTAYFYEYSFLDFLFYTEDGSSKFLRNVNELLSDYTGQ